MGKILKLFGVTFGVSLIDYALALLSSIVIIKQLSVSDYGYYNLLNIYFPMHYQPELTSCPLGGHYTDQWLIIKMLDALLPEGYYLYVKEHPKQEAAGRYKDYYQDIVKHTKRTVLVDTTVASSKLMESCKAVVSITGTAAGKLCSS